MIIIIIQHSLSKNAKLKGFNVKMPDNASLHICTNLHTIPLFIYSVYVLRIFKTFLFWTRIRKAEVVGQTTSICKQEVKITILFSMCP